MGQRNSSAHGGDGEPTLDHARSCVLDNSVYVYQPRGIQKKIVGVINAVAQLHFQGITFIILLYHLHD